MTHSFIWTHGMLLNLIDLFRERALLWDPSSEDYKKRDKKYEAWQEIADTLELDRQTVEKKMKILVGQYRRELVKEGQGHQSRWFAFSRLSFLGSSLESATHSSSGNEQVHQEFIDTRSESSNVEDSYDHHEDISRKRVKLIKRHDQNESTSEQVGTSDLVALFREEKRLRDENTVFGEHVAHKLKRISNHKAKATTQYLINQILYNAEMGKYNKTDDSRRASSSTGYRATVTEPDLVAVDNPKFVAFKLENEIWID